MRCAFLFWFDLKTLLFEHLVTVPPLCVVSRPLPKVEQRGRGVFRFVVSFLPVRGEFPHGLLFPLLSPLSFYLFLPFAPAPRRGHCFPHCFSSSRGQCLILVRAESFARSKYLYLCSSSLLCFSLVYCSRWGFFDLLISLFSPVRFPFRHLISLVPARRFICFTTHRTKRLQTGKVVQFHLSIIHLSPFPPRLPPSASLPSFFDFPLSSIRVPVEFRPLLKFFQVGRIKQRTTFDPLLLSIIPSPSVLSDLSYFFDSSPLLSVNIFF